MPYKIKKRPLRLLKDKNKLPYIKYKGKDISLKGYNIDEIIKIINKLTKQIKKKKLLPEEKKAKKSKISGYISGLITSTMGSSGQVIESRLKEDTEKINELKKENDILKTVVITGNKGINENESTIKAIEQAKEQLAIEFKSLQQENKELQKYVSLKKKDLKDLIYYDVDKNQYELKTSKYIFSGNIDNIKQEIDNHVTNNFMKQKELNERIELLNEKQMKMESDQQELTTKLKLAEREFKKNELEKQRLEKETELIKKEAEKIGLENIELQKNKNVFEVQKFFSKNQIKLDDIKNIAKKYNINYKDTDTIENIAENIAKNTNSKIDGKKIKINNDIYESKGQKKIQIIEPELQPKLEQIQMKEPESQPKEQQIQIKKSPKKQEIEQSIKILPKKQEIELTEEELEKKQKKKSERSKKYIKLDQEKTELEQVKKDLEKKLNVLKNEEKRLKKMKPDFENTQEQIEKQIKENKIELDEKNIEIQSYNNKINDINKEIESTLQEGDGKMRGGLWTNQINKIMQANKYYIDTIAADEIDDIINYIEKNKILRGCFIMNTLKSIDKGVGHWVAVYYDVRPDGEYTCEYYDPFGENPKDDNLIKKLKKMFENMQIDAYVKCKINQVKQQSISSSNCGWYCIKFILERINDISFKEATKYKKIGQNEQDIKEIKKNYNKYGFI